jgi:ABC-2 type transport system ATP-binding protein
MDILEIENLKVDFDKKFTLRVDSFTIRDSGGIVAILGRNGSGKTTFFNAILNLIPHTGVIKIFDIKNSDSVSLWKEKTGVFLDDSYLIDYLYPEEYFELLYSFPKSNSFELKEFYLEFEEFFANDILGTSKLIKSFSTGNRAKIGIAGAFLHNPRLIFLDEPFAHLDNPSKMALKSIITSRRIREKVSILFSSHDFDIVRQIADRVLLLREGLLNLDTSVEDLEMETLLNFVG